MNDGSRKINQIAEAVGLNESNQYVVRPIYKSRLEGRMPDGRLIVNLEHTGEKPTFANGPREKGLEDLINLTRNVWAD